MRESAGMEVPFGAGQGTYAVTRWPGADGVPTLLAAHGIAANSLAWAPVAAKLPDVDLDALLEGMLGPVMRKLRSACVAEAVRDDAADELRNQEVITAIRRLPVPATFLYAERGLMNEAVGLYRPGGGPRRARHRVPLPAGHQPLLDRPRRRRRGVGRGRGQGAALGDPYRQDGRPPNCQLWTSISA